MKLVGNDAQLKHLAALLGAGSRAILLTGPRSVGKFSAARELARGLSAPADTFVVQGPDSADALSADKAREISRFLSTAPLSSPSKTVLARLDGASREAQNALLKVIEESSHAVFLLVASGAVLPTIASRCALVRFGVLSDDQVREALIGTGMDGASAARWSPAGHGSVRAAQAAVSSSGLRARVIAALRAALGGDAGQLDRALAGWDGDAQALLLTWAQEAATSRWRIFSADAVPGAGSREGRRVLVASCGVSTARPALAAATALSAMKEDVRG